MLVCLPAAALGTGWAFSFFLNWSMTSIVLQNHLQVWTFEAQDAVFTFTPTHPAGPKSSGPKPAAQEIVVDGKLKIVSVDQKLMNGA